MAADNLFYFLSWGPAPKSLLGAFHPPDPLKKVLGCAVAGLLRAITSCRRAAVRRHPVGKQF